MPLPSPSPSSLPLSGLRVVALEQAVAAPFCSRQLADMGADVVKIERPGEGDLARGYDNALRGVSAYFAWLNRGKRSVVLDLKRDDDHATCVKLLDRADVFIHNLIPGGVERLGFGYDELAARNPRLIWLGISGYGPDGPYRDKKAYDMLIQAESGLVSVTGEPDAPAKVGVSMADIASGLYGYSSILTALLNRERTGRGERIDIAMLDCLVEWMTPPLYIWLGQGRVIPRAGLRHNMIVPYGAYHCRDGAVLLGIQNGREWERFCVETLGRPDLLADPRFVSNESRLAHRDVLEAEIERVLGELPRAEVLARLDAAGIANAALNDIPAVAAHPQLQARGRWTEVETWEGLVPALWPPHNLASVTPVMGRVPALGEHTAAVLAELAEDEA